VAPHASLHIYDAVLKDFSGILRYLADSAHILIHGTYHQGIDQAVREVIKTNSGLIDCGFITREPSIGYPVSYQGLRLVRKGAEDSEQLISESYERNNQKTPPFAREYWYFDEYYNRIWKRQQRIPVVQQFTFRGILTELFQQF
jgi:hypothetical protein